MSIVLIVLHVFVCVFLIAVVLLQRGKGAEIGAVFGGGASSTVFGSRGAGTFLSRLTTISAALFMVTSLGLSYLWTRESTERLFTDPAAAQVPAAAEKPIFEGRAIEPLDDGLHFIGSRGFDKCESLRFLSFVVSDDLDRIGDQVFGGQPAFNIVGGDPGREVAKKDSKAQWLFCSIGLELWRVQREGLSDGIKI